MAEIEIVDYVAAVEPNPYTPFIEALTKAGEGKAGRVTITRDAETKTKRLVRAAANAVGLTASLRGTEDDVDEAERASTDELVLTYTVGPKQNRVGRAGNPTPETAAK